MAKDNYYTCGTDFYQDHSGRFCEFIGLPSLPSHTDTQGQRTSILSGSITSETGKFLAFHKIGLRKFLLANVDPLGYCILGQGQQRWPSQEGVPIIWTSTTKASSSTATFMASSETSSTTQQAMIDLFNHVDLIHKLMIIVLSGRIHNYRPCVAGLEGTGDMTCLPMQVPCLKRDQYSSGMP
ncbi:hypothetical protein QJS10_CPA08g01225 [Acorus calamus]|uniref:Uncharacterized protein n=1 Tax=Acorus calamus TaxID=4465 RepID=A0AAV9EDC2_ACOCL|nr:hypothetical protein QJS10_CPA08g01225 [Acorus calamus]